MARRSDDVDSRLAELVDEQVSEANWETWLAEHPEAAAEVEIARKVRLLLLNMRDVPVEVPPDFEARVLARVRDDTMMLDLIDLGLAGWSTAIMELIAMLLNLFPTVMPSPTPS